MKQSGQAGFILVEILFAIIIISVAVMAAAAMFIPATQAYSGAADMTAAAALAQKQVELLKAQPPSFWRESLPETVPWQGTETMPLRLNGVEYRIITRLQAPAGNSLIETQVTVDWRKGGSDHSLQMLAIFARE